MFIWVCVHVFSDCCLFLSYDSFSQFCCFGENTSANSLLQYRVITPELLYSYCKNTVLLNWVEKEGAVDDKTEASWAKNDAE